MVGCIETKKNRQKGRKFKKDPFKFCTEYASKEGANRIKDDQIRFKLTLEESFRNCNSILLSTSVASVPPRLIVSNSLGC